MKDISIDRPGHKWTYDELAERADEASAILLAKGVRVNPTSMLAVALNKSRELLAAWRDDSLGMDAKVATLIDAGNANRIADAVINSREDVDADTLSCLRRMARNSIDLEGRELSDAKNVFWELDLLTRLRRHGVRARLAEPPDIAADFGFGDYGISCKKSYSERTVEEQIRKGAQQIERAGLKGIVAINLDQLVPAYEVLQRRTAAAASNALSSMLTGFIGRHRSSMTKFAKTHRIDAVLLSVTAHVEAELSKPSFSTFSEMAIWHLTWKPPTRESSEAAARLRHVKLAFPYAQSETMQ